MELDAVTDEEKGNQNFQKVFGLIGLTVLYNMYGVAKTAFKPEWFKFE